MKWIKKTCLQCHSTALWCLFVVFTVFFLFFFVGGGALFRNHCYSFQRTKWRLVTSIWQGPGPIAIRMPFFSPILKSVATFSAPAQEGNLLFLSGRSERGNVLVVNARISWGHMEQLVAIMAVCRLAILKRMPATPLTLLVAHRLQEQVKAQVQRSEKMKTYGGSRTQRANIRNSQIVFFQNSICSFWTN